MASVDHWASVRDEAVARLQTLRRIDTTNLPDNEAAAEFLADVLRDEGFEPRVLEGAQ